MDRIKTFDTSKIHTLLAKPSQADSKEMNYKMEYDVL